MIEKWIFVFCFLFLLDSGAVWVGDVSLSRCLIATFFPLIIMYYGLKKRSLDISGALVGWTVAFSQMISHTALFLSLFVFFVTSSILTKFKSKQKSKLEDDFKEGGQRNWVQVCSRYFTSSSLLFSYFVTVIEDLLFS
jgi:uncharacterized membrane protein